MLSSLLIIAENVTACQINCVQSVVIQQQLSLTVVLTSIITSINQIQTKRPVLIIIFISFRPKSPPILSYYDVNVLIQLISEHDLTNYLLNAILYDCLVSLTLLS